MLNRSIASLWLQRAAQFVVGLFLGTLVVYGDPSSSSSEFIARWQTLIAGGLAALAAYFTIRKMHETDVRAEGRHMDLLAVSLQEPRLKLVRLEAVIEEDMQRLLRAEGLLQHYFQNLSRRNSLDRPPEIGWSGATKETATLHSQFSWQLDLMRQECADLIASTRDTTYGEAMSLFGPRQAMRYGLLLNNLPELDRLEGPVNSSDWVRHSNSPSELYELDHGLLQVHGDMWAETLYRAMSNLKGFHDSVLELLEGYPELSVRTPFKRWRDQW